MNTRELEYFITIAKEKNLSKAAQVLYVSQPALSKYINRIEKEMGTSLFQRFGKKMELTYAGERYKFYAEKILFLEKSMNAEFTEINESISGRLHIGMPPLRCSFTIPVVLPQYKRLYPKIDVVVQENNSEELEKALLQGSIDIAFYNRLIETKGLHYQVLHKDIMYAISKKGLSLGNKKEDGVSSITLEDILDQTWIIQSTKQRMGQFMHEVIHIKGIKPTVMVNMNIRANVSLAASGYGITFISDDLLRNLNQEEEFDVYKIDDLPLEMQFVAAWKEDAMIPDYMRSFIQLMAKV